MLVHALHDPFTKCISYPPYLPTSLRAQAMSVCHSDLKSSHYGGLRTYAALQHRAFWPGMYNDTQKFVNHCEQCQRFGNHPAKVRKVHHLTSHTPGDHWVIDVCHMEKADNGCEWMLTMVDVCTRWAIVQPLHELTAEAAAQAPQAVTMAVVILLIQQFTKSKPFQPHT